MNHSPSAEWWRPDLVVQGEHGSGGIAGGKPNVPESAVPFWGLMSFTFILLIAPQTFFPALVPLRIALLTASVAISVYLIERLLHRRPLMILTREMRVTGCLVGWAALTVPLSYWPGGSVEFLLGFYFKTIAIFWLLSNTVNTLARLRQVAWGLSLMTIPLAASGVSQYFSGNFIADGNGEPYRRLRGTANGESERSGSYA